MQTVSSAILDGEVLGELSVDEIGPPQLLLPVAIRCDLIDEHSSLLAAVASQVALTIAIQIQSSGSTAAADRIFPDPGVDGTPLPLDIATALSAPPTVQYSLDHAERLAEARTAAQLAARPIVTPLKKRHRHHRSTK